MICFVTNKDDGKLVIGLGLSDGNITQLKANRPIWKPWSSFNLDWGDGGIFMYYVPPGKDFRLKPPHDEVVIFRLGDEVLNQIHKGTMALPCGCEVDGQKKEVEFVLFAGESEDKLHKQFLDAGLIGPETKTIGPYVNHGQHKH